MPALLAKLLSSRRALRPSGVDAANPLVPAAAPVRIFRAPPLGALHPHRPLASLAHAPRLNRAY